MPTKPNMRMGGVDTRGDSGVMNAAMGTAQIKAAAQDKSGLNAVAGQLSGWADEELQEERRMRLEARAESRGIAKEGRDEAKAIAKEGRQAGVLEQAQAREDELLAEERAYDKPYREAQIDKMKADTAYTEAGKGKGKAAKSTVKVSEIDKMKIKDINAKLEMLHPEDDAKQIAQLERAKQGLYIKYDPEAQSKLERQRELLAKDDGESVTTTSDVPTKASKPTVYSELKELRELEVKMRPNSPTLKPAEYKKVRERISEIKEKYNK